MANYDSMINNYKSLYSLDNTTFTDWQKVLNVPGGRPVEAYRQFENLSDAQTLIQGNTVEGQTYYDVYAGALISIINDRVVNNNGLYQVIFNPSYGTNDNRKFLLDRFYDASTTETIINEKNLYFKNVNDQSVGSDKLVYFVGTDKSESHYDTSVYTLPDVAYDKSGNLYGTTFIQSSDIRLKDHIEELDVDLGKIGEIDKIRFTWKDNMNGKRQIGTTAQSLETTFPDLVYTNPDTGYKAVNYEGLSVIALAAIDKLYARVRDLENEVRKLKARKTEQ